MKGRQGEKTGKEREIYNMFKGVSDDEEEG